MEEINLETLQTAQFFDFNRVGEIVPDESFFEKNDDDADSICLEVANTIRRKERTSDSAASAKKALNGSRRVFRFTAVPNMPAKPGCKVKRASSASNSKNKMKKKAVSGSLTKPSLSQKRSTTALKPVVKRAVPEGTKRTERLKNNNNPTQNGMAAKRSAPFANPRPLKQRKKGTHPTTPECLKRSNKPGAKVIKSSEEMELEHIAMLQKKMHQHLKANQDTMKKINYGSALKPIINKQKLSEVKTRDLKSANKCPEPKIKPLPRSDRNKVQSSHQPKLDSASFQVPAEFGKPLRTSTPFISLKRNPAYHLAGLVGAARYPEPPVEVSINTSHTGMVFIGKEKKALQKDKSACSKADFSARKGDSDVSLNHLSVCLKKMTVKELSPYLPPSEIKRLTGQNEKPLGKPVGKAKSVISRTKIAKESCDERAVKSPLLDVTSAYKNRLVSESMKKQRPEADIVVKPQRFEVLQDPKKYSVSKCTRSKSFKTGDYKAPTCGAKRAQPCPKHISVHKKK